MTEVAAALIWKGEGAERKFMICRRPENKKRGMLWEFVGGKLEKGEDVYAALVRECEEELGIIAEPYGTFADVIHEYPDITVHLTVLEARIARGEPQKLEHSDIRWISPREIPQYEFCPADEKVLEKISKAYEKDVFDMLAAKAAEMTALSYCPYSAHAVGAALICKDGTVYTGCNIESASYSPSCCAERVAIFKAVSEGKRDFDAIAVACSYDGKMSSDFPPCGVCRQVMLEFCEKDFKILTVGGQNSEGGYEYKVYTLSELMPYGFSPSSL